MSRQRVGFQEGVTARRGQLRLVLLPGGMLQQQDHAQLAEQEAGLAPKQTAEPIAVHRFPMGVHHHQVRLGPGLLDQGVQGIRQHADGVATGLEGRTKALHNVRMLGDG